MQESQLDKRDDKDDDEQNDCHGGGAAHAEELESGVVHVEYDHHGAVGRTTSTRLPGDACGGREDDIEHLKGTDGVGHYDEKQHRAQQRQSDMPEGLPPIGPIYSRRVIILLRDPLHTCQVDNDIVTYILVHSDANDAGQRLIRAREKRLQWKAKQPQEGVDQTEILVQQHSPHHAQCQRGCDDRKDEESTPEDASPEAGIEQ